MNYQRISQVALGSDLTTKDAGEVFHALIADLKTQRGIARGGGTRDDQAEVEASARALLDMSVTDPSFFKTTTRFPTSRRTLENIRASQRFTGITAKFVREHGVEGVWAAGFGEPVRDTTFNDSHTIAHRESDEPVEVMGTYQSPRAVSPRYVEVPERTTEIGLRTVPDPNAPEPGWHRVVASGDVLDEPDEVLYVREGSDGSPEFRIAEGTYGHGFDHGRPGRWSSRTDSADLVSEWADGHAAQHNLAMGLEGAEDSFRFLRSPQGAISGVSWVRTGLLEPPDEDDRW
jgi:hypothetical protein